MGAASLRTAAQDVGAIFTVDGPRGPRHKVKPGAVFLALLAGSPVVPVRVVMERRWILWRAWDKFQVPWPFSRCTIVFFNELGILSLKQFFNAFLFI